MRGAIIRVYTWIRSFLLIQILIASLVEAVDETAVWQPPREVTFINPTTGEHRTTYGNLSRYPPLPTAGERGLRTHGNGGISLFARAFFGSAPEYFAYLAPSLAVFWPLEKGQLVLVLDKESEKDSQFAKEAVELWPYPSVGYASIGSDLDSSLPGHAMQQFAYFWVSTASTKAFLPFAIK